MNDYAERLERCALMLQCPIEHVLAPFMFIGLFGCGLNEKLQQAEAYCTHFGVFETSVEADVTHTETTTVESMMELYEVYCNHSFDGETWSPSKSQQGVFYTPKAGVDYAINTVRDQLDRAESVLDPSMGCGAFVRSVFQHYCETMTPLEALDRVYGVDIDPYAVSLVRIWFCRQVGVEHAETVAKHFQLGDAIHGMASFKTFTEKFSEHAETFDLSVLERDNVVWFADFYDVAISGGFDVVIGNPPWHMMSAEETKRFRDSIGFEYPVHCDKGRSDLWRLLVERSTWLLKPGGTMALYVPWSLQAQRDERYLRAYLVQTGSIETFVVFGNRVLFPSVAKGTILFSWQRGAPQGKVQFAPRAKVVDERVEAETQLVEIADIFPKHNESEFTFSDMFEIKRGLQDDRNWKRVPWDPSIPLRDAHFDSADQAREMFECDIVPFHVSQGVLPFGVYRGFAERTKSRWRYGTKSKKAGQSKLRYAPVGIMPVKEGYEAIIVKAKMSPASKRRLVAAPCGTDEYGSDSVCFVRIPPLSYSPLFVLGLLNSEYLEAVIRRNHPTTSSLSIGKLPFRKLDTFDPESDESSAVVEAYYTVIRCTRALVDLRNQLTEALYREELEELGRTGQDIEDLTTEDRLDLKRARLLATGARRRWDEESPRILEVLNAAVEVYYNC